MLKNTRNAAFTIVELIVVISVIAILVGVTIVSYGAWKNQTAIGAVKSDLTNAASFMESKRGFSGSYPTEPTTLVSLGFSYSDGVSLELKGSDSTVFCINGTSSSSSTIQFYIDSSNRVTGPVAGTCGTRPAADVPTAPTLLLATQTVNLNFLSDIRLQWSNPTPNYATQYQIQCAGDAGFVVGVNKATLLGKNTIEKYYYDQARATTYFCRVRAENANGASAWSNVLTVNT